MLEEALSNYAITVKASELIRHNENMTYKIRGKNQKYILRIHKPIKGFNLGLLRMGKEAFFMIEEEMILLDTLAKKTNLGTQRVVRNKQDQFVTILADGTPATLLEWVNGCTLEQVTLTDAICFELGVMIAKMHQGFHEISLCHRYRYDGELLSKMMEEACVAYECGHFTEEQMKVIGKTLELIQEYMVSNQQRFTLVHSDLSLSNLIYENGSIIPIDFSLSGSSVPEMDVASVCSHIVKREFHQAIRNGYESILGDCLDSKGIEACSCLQILLFVVCQHNAVAKESWFPDALNRWCKDFFLPLIQMK